MNAKPQNEGLGRRLAQLADYITLDSEHELDELKFDEWWRRLCSWPPNVVALTAALLHESGLYREYEASYSAEEIRAVVDRWLDTLANVRLDVGNCCSTITGELPKELADAGTLIKGIFDEPVLSDDAERDLCNALGLLHGLADEACVLMALPAVDEIIEIEETGEICDMLRKHNDWSKVDNATASKASKQAWDALEKNAPTYYRSFAAAELLSEVSIPASVDAIFHGCRRLAERYLVVPAWRMSLLYYDQVFKRSLKDNRRHHLGNSLFGLAKVGEYLGHASAVRHYAQLALVADILWEDNHENLGNLGAAAHLLARSVDVTKLVDDLRSDWKEKDKSRPVFPEYLLASRWFDAAADKSTLLTLAQDTVHQKPFIAHILERHAREPRPDRKQLLLAVLATLLLNTTPGFEVRKGARRGDGLEVLATYRRSTFSNGFLPEGHVRMACLPSAAPRDTAARWKAEGAAFGIIVTADRCEHPTDSPADCPLLGLCLADHREFKYHLTGLEPRLTARLDDLRFGGA